MHRRFDFFLIPLGEGVEAAEIRVIVPGTHLSSIEVR